jgi:hypothetical protein
MRKNILHFSNFEAIPNFTVMNIERLVGVHFDGGHDTSEPQLLNCPAVKQCCWGRKMDLPVRLRKKSKRIHSSVS